MKINLVLIMSLLFFTTLARGEQYTYIDDNGIMHVTENISNVPEEKRRKVESIKEEAFSTNSGTATIANYLEYSNLSETDRCYLKLFNGMREGQPSSDRDREISQEQFDKIKAFTQQVSGVNDEMVCDLVAPDARFSSPERTWSLYKQALKKGEIDAALECFTLDSAKRYKEVFTVLGKEKMKEMALEMRPIQKIRQGADYAKYRIRRSQLGQEITYYIYFSNRFGNWKINQF